MKTSKVSKAVLWVRAVALRQCPHRELAFSDSLWPLYLLFEVSFMKIHSSLLLQPKNLVLLIVCEGKSYSILAGIKAENHVSPKAEANRNEQRLTHCQGPFRVPSQIICVIIQHFWMLSHQCLKCNIGFLFKAVTLPAQTWHLPGQEGKSSIQKNSGEFHFGKGREHLGREEQSW